jgi:hypothetical protein
MTRLIRIGGKTLLALGALLLSFAAVVFAINARDEQLSPQAVALLEPPPNPLAAEDNAYLWLIGSGAPEGASPVAAGEARVTGEIRLFALIRSDPEAANGLIRQEMAAISAGSKVKAPEHFCADGVERIWETLSTRRAEVVALLAANRELMDRYAASKRARGYFDVNPASVSGLVPFLSSGTRCLFLADIATRLRAGTAGERRKALAELSEDTRLWQSILTADTEIGSTMVAANALRANFFLVADFVAASLDAVGTEDTLEDAELALGSTSAWSIGPAFARQFRQFADIVRWQVPCEQPGTQLPKMCAEVSWWQRLSGRVSAHFYKRNATINLAAERDRRLAELAATVTSTLPAGIDAYVRWSDDALGPGNDLSWSGSIGWLIERARRKPFGFAYNPFGAVLVNNSSEPGVGWVRTISDAVAVQRAVRMGIEIRRMHTPPAAVPDLMRQHPEWSMHPGTGKPIDWDQAGGALTIKPASHWSGPERRRFSVPTWHARVAS